LLLDTRHNAALAQECWQRYFRLAQRTSRQPDSRPFSLVRKAAIESPISFHHNYNSFRQNSNFSDEQAIRLELVQLLYANQWNDTLDFLKMLRFFQQHHRVGLVDWAESVAIRQIPGRQGADASISRLRSSWRPLLIEELSKDVYNKLAEMQAVLESDAFDDAAQMIASISPETGGGVSPHGGDRQLLVSLPSAVRLALRDHPQLEAVMRQKFGPLAELRVRQAISASHVAGVELAAVQFESTPAAAEARGWLGDRALSSGWFARASTEYERALRTAPSAAKHDLLARIRLAAAMRGEDAGEPVTQPVVFSETTMPAAEFEAMVADLRKANSDATSPSATAAPNQRVWPALKPTGYEVNVRGRLDGAVGDDPNAEITRHINSLGINWCERQLAPLVEGNTLYVSNRFQVAAYDLTNGQRIWQSTRLPGGMMRSREWSLIPMRTLVTAQHVFVRLLYGSGPVLAAFEKPTGRLVWSSEYRTNEYIVSDPLLVQDQLLAFTLLRAEQGECTLRLSTFDRGTGEPILHHPLVKLNEVWWTRRLCEVAATDGGLVASLGGVSLCCDLAGTVRWIRKSVALPPEEETSWVRQYFERPLAIKEGVVITQPGVRAIECVDPETGRRRWSRVLPDVETLVGEIDGKLIVRTLTEFIALSAADGNELWRHERPEVFDAVLLGGEGGLMYVARDKHAERQDRFVPRLVWLDPATGKPAASFVLPSLEDPDAHFGPLISRNDRLWSFWGKGQAEPNRELVELVPKADAPVIAP
jgi:outer membrane protein assembly factor BamB